MAIDAYEFWIQDTQWHALSQDVETLVNARGPSAKAKTVKSDSTRAVM